MVNFPFGQPSASSSGNTPSPFATAGNKDSNAAPNLFGGANKTGAPATTGFSFGPTASTPAQAPSPFASTPSTQTPTTAGFSFGQKAPGQKSSNPTTPGVAPTANPFGAAGAGALLGNPNAAATPAASNANKPSLFSTTPAGPPPTQSSSLFGDAAKPAVSLFGQKPQGKTADAPEPAPLFGSAPGAGAAGSAFGQKTSDAPASAPLFGSSAAAPSLFGQKPADAPTKPMFSLGGATSSTPQSAPANKPTFSLGGNTSQPPASTQPASATTSAPSGDLFGGVGGASSSATSAPSLFGAKKDDAANKPASPAGAMFASMGQNKDAADKPAPAQDKDEAAEPATAASNLFGSVGTNKDDAAKHAAPAGGLFGSLGGQKEDEPAASSSAAAPTSTTATSGSTSAFSLGAKPAAAPSSFGADGSAFSLKPAPAAAAGTSSTPTASSTTANTLNASTSGPTPPATSRLNSKSLDEIITLWTTSLSSHQKQFSNLATKIGSWDRMLVENSDKISKLYSRTFQAERDTAEVERQLTSVEGQQEELSHWLDHYERVLDDMAAKAGGVDSGVDAERERTYRTAERCSARLTTMSHDLTSMIEEINLASSNLSKSSRTAESDPLSQIVRVLNAHLGQLQQIDVGAEQLRHKVETAQKEVRGFGGRNDIDGGIEGFMRSLRR